MFSSKQKRVHHNSLIGMQGEALVTARISEMGFVPQPLNRLETGIDIMVELRQPDGVALAKWFGIQVKTTEGARYTAETDSSFEYLVEAADLAYWDNANIPAILVVVRLSDSSLFWRPVDQGRKGEPRRLEFNKERDVFDSRAKDALGALTVDKYAPGSFIPPLQSDEPAHLNLVRMILPDEIFVAESPFKSGREAVRAMHKHPGPHHYDWVIRDRSFWSFRDPTGTSLEEVIDIETLEAVDSESVTLLDDADDQNAVIDLLRRSVEAQLQNELLFDRDSRALFFRAPGPGMRREYKYQSLSNPTSAEVVTLIEKAGRDAIMRHHAFSPRYQRIGDDWFMSITSTYVFTVDGYRPHPASSTMLAGKKKLEKSNSMRGLFLMWRHFLIESGDGKPTSLFDDDFPMDCRPKISFEAIAPLAMSVAVPEAVWGSEDPEEVDRMQMGLLL